MTVVTTTEAYFRPVNVPEIRYARSGDVSIAYQVAGEGSVDLVLVPFLTNLSSIWGNPRFAEQLRRLASFSRLIVFDKRGMGLSDRSYALPTLEARMDDVRAVMDAVGCERAVLVGSSDGGQMTALFAATYPERTSALVLANTVARYVSTVDYPWGRTTDEWRMYVRDVREGWGERDFLERHLDSVDPELATDDEFRRWYVTNARLAWSPAAAAAFYRMMADTDIRDVLPAIRVPTLVIYRAANRRPCRYLAERIPDARVVEIPGRGLMMSTGRAFPDEVERFVATIEARPEPDRVLATLLFTDIAGSTEKAAELGDRRWRELLGQHHALTRRLLAQFRGEELDTAGDGFFASFDGPGRAITCACAIRDEMRALELEIRAGIHTGECERVDEKLTGIAVSLGARVAAEAAPGEVLVTSTVRDLVAGSGLGFDDRGDRELKGVPRSWRLFAVVPSAT